MMRLNPSIKMTGIIILAAGSSSRLGQPKQNLVYENQTLLQRAIGTALQTGNPVIVILGANEAVIKPTIQRLPADVVLNSNWKEGMSSSIRTGIHHLQNHHPKITSVILMLCDQPFVDAELLNNLLPANKSKAIVASGYNNTIGAPAFFDGYYFSELLLLKGSEGAKHLMLRHEEQVVVVPFPLGDVDIDTVEDFERFKS